MVGDVIIRIYDVSGRLLIDDKLYVNDVILLKDYDLSIYEYGTYMLQIITKDGIQVKPIILDRK